MVVQTSEPDFLKCAGAVIGAKLPLDSCVVARRLMDMFSYLSEDQQLLVVEEDSDAKLLATMKRMNPNLIIAKFPSEAPPEYPFDLSIAKLARQDSYHSLLVGDMKAFLADVPICERQMKES